MLHKVGHLSDIPDDDALTVDIEGRPIGVFRAAGKVFAVKNICPHKRAPLARGTVQGTMLPTSCAGQYQYGMENQVLKCPWHGWEFDLETGKCLFGVSNSRIKTYEVSIQNDEIYVDV